MENAASARGLKPHSHPASQMSELKKKKVASGSDLLSFFLSSIINI